MSIRKEDIYKRPTIDDMGGLPGIYGDRYQEFIGDLDNNKRDPKQYPKSDMLKKWKISRSTLKKRIERDNIERGIDT